MPDDLCALIQNMVRARVRQNWPRVRAHECRKQQAAVLAVGEWAVVQSSSEMGNYWIGRVLLQIGVLPHNARDYFKPASALPFILDWYSQVPDSCHYVKWSASAPSKDQLVPPSALVAVGFSMTAVSSLPLEWPLHKRRPAGKRRIGYAYVMPDETVSQLAQLL